MAKGDVFRLYILGQLRFDDPQSAQELTTLAVYGTARKLSRVKIAPGEIQKLADVVRNLRAFMIDGRNPFDESQLVQLGSRLFDMIVGQEVRSLLTVAPAAAQYEPVPLEIIVENHTVAAWPWEYLYDMNNAKYLCREYYPISRSTFNLDPIKACGAKDPPVRILFVLGASRLDSEAGVDEQLNRHKDLFRPLEEKGLINADFIEAADPMRMHQAMTQGSYDVLHFFGHAGYDAEAKEGYLRFDAPDTRGFRYYANSLAGFLLGKRIRMVFLNACETGVGAPGLDPSRSAVASAILARGIPAVIATQFEMPDNSAHFFSTNVYSAIFSGASLTDAMRGGRQTMNFNTKVRHPDWGIPVLYASFPDLVLFPPKGL